MGSFEAVLGCSGLSLAYFRAGAAGALNCTLLGASTVQNASHAKPMVAATERLLHERFPRAVVIERSDKSTREEELGAA